MGYTEKVQKINFHVPTGLRTISLYNSSYKLYIMAIYNRKLYDANKADGYKMMVAGNFFEGFIYLGIIQSQPEALI